MTPKKQKNGKWYAQVYIGKDDNGKRIYKRVSADTKAECQHLASLCKIEGVKSADRRTIGDIVDKYIDSIEHVASPSTIKAYKAMRRNNFKDLMGVCVEGVNNNVMQNAINNECQRLTYRKEKISAKSVNNAWGMIEVSMRRICNMTFQVKLPQEESKIKEFPLPQEIIKAIKGTDVELPCLLSMWLSLSMSEVRGLDCSAIRNGVLHVEQVRIETEAGDVVKKTGKVKTRIRNHVLPDYLMQLINNTPTYQNYLETGENQPLIPMTRHVIYGHWKKICKENGWSMTYHDLRAESASICLLLSIPDKYALQRGGWSTTEVYKRVYQQTFSEERLLVDKKINDYIEQFID